VKNEEATINAMTLESYKELAQKLIQPEHMYYAVVGDAGTQLKSLEDLASGKPILVAN